MTINNAPWIYSNQMGHKFEIGNKAIELMITFIQNSPSMPESGGVLLGRFIINSNDVVVDKVTVPTQGDRQGRFRFFRSHKPHQARIDEEWITSEGTCNYLGEWHTHPEANPIPSFCDLANWKKRLIFDRFDSDSLFFVIVGTEQINVWQGFRRTLAIEPLAIIRY
jgi:integrative and conjugative element protein (TIGR02256 family)